MQIIILIYKVTFIWIYMSLVFTVLQMWESFAKILIQIIKRENFVFHWGAKYFWWRARFGPQSAISPTTAAKGSVTVVFSRFNFYTGF